MGIYNSMKKIGFSMAEAIIVMIMLGVIAALTIPTILGVDSTEKSNAAMARKIQASFEQAFAEMILLDSPLDDLKLLKDDLGKFSIEDANIDKRFIALFKKYIPDIGNIINLANKNEKAYFDSNIKFYGRTDSAFKLGETYNNFYFINNGCLLGFKFYQSCDATETIANYPERTRVSSVDKICASIFLDINGYKKPNKLGSDQYIFPIDRRGIKYMTEEEVVPEATTD